MTLDRMLLVTALALMALWLAALTVGQRRARARAGEPVYRRLPDGRLAFQWSVHTAYRSARRSARPAPSVNRVGRGPRRP